jgi:hypothetical protein
MCGQTSSASASFNPSCWGGTVLSIPNLGMAHALVVLLLYGIRPDCCSRASCAAVSVFKHRCTRSSLTRVLGAAASWRRPGSCLLVCACMFPLHHLSLFASGQGMACCTCVCLPFAVPVCHPPVARTMAVILGAAVPRACSCLFPFSGQCESHGIAGARGAAASWRAWPLHSTERFTFGKNEGSGTASMLRPRGSREHMWSAQLCQQRA